MKKPTPAEQEIIRAFRAYQDAITTAFLLRALVRSHDPKHADALHDITVATRELLEANRAASV